jgi:hypothetical protein
MLVDLEGERRMSVYEWRTYDIRIGQMPAYLACFEDRGLPVLCRYAQPAGFWVSGALETGSLNTVNHIWRYDSVEARLERRAALYADAAWTEGFVPASAAMMERLHSRLMIDALAGSRPMESEGGRVVASTYPPGAVAPAGGISCWQLITGAVGSLLTLDPLTGFSWESGKHPAPATREIWNRASFSALG